MKVLGINGSARKDGNTAVMIQKAFEELEAAGIETELVQFSGAVIEPCKACWACAGQKNCVHQNGIFRGTFEKMVQADGIILGSPVYSANISANMQAFLERAAVVSDMNPGLFRHKAGAAVAAARRGGALTTIDAMNHFFLLQDMFIVGLSYWGMAYGKMPGEVTEDTEGMETVKSLGRNMAFLLKALTTYFHHALFSFSPYNLAWFLFPAQ